MTREGRGSSRKCISCAAGWKRLQLEGEFEEAAPVTVEQFYRSDTRTENRGN